MTSKTARPESEPAATAVTIDHTELEAEHAEKLIRPLLADDGRHVDVTLGNGDVSISDEYVDALFGSLMQSAMATGGRRLAVEWMNRLEVLGNVGERAHRAMAKTINLDLRFGMLSPPLAEQAGCRPELLEHEQQDADAIARLAVHGIATDGEVHKMRQRLVTRIVKAVLADTHPQSLGAKAKKPDGSAADPNRAAPAPRGRG